MCLCVRELWCFCRLRCLRCPKLNISINKDVYTVRWKKKKQEKTKRTPASRWTTLTRQNGTFRELWREHRTRSTLNREVWNVSINHKHTYRTSTACIYTHTNTTETVSPKSLENKQTSSRSIWWHVVGRCRRRRRAFMSPSVVRSFVRSSHIPLSGQKYTNFFIYLLWWKTMLL